MQASVKYVLFPRTFCSCSQIILLKNETNKSVFLNYIDNHSIIFQITLLLIQMIINNNQTHLKEFPFEYFGIIVNVINKLDDFSKMVLRVISEEHKTKENHTTNDKYYMAFDEFFEFMN